MGMGVWHHIWDIDIESSTIESIHVVFEFKEVCPTNLSGMPLDKYIDFSLYLELRTHPISLPPYRMALIELRDVNARILELLDKCYICASASPLGTPLMFVRKMDGSMRMSIDYRQLNRVAFLN